MNSFTIYGLFSSQGQSQCTSYILYICTKAKSACSVSQLDVWQTFVPLLSKHSINTTQLSNEPLKPW